MPLPLIPIIIAGGATLLAERKRRDLRDEKERPSRRGYCSNCGKTTKHRYTESGMQWRNGGAVAVAGGLGGLGIAALLVRDIYTCSKCSAKTLPCRMPRCKGMANSGQFYDDEFCGECIEANSNEDYQRRLETEKTLHKVQKLLALKQKRIDQLQAKISKLKKDRNHDKALLRELLAQLEGEKRELRQVQGRR